MTKQNKNLIIILTIGVLGILNTKMGIVLILPKKQVTVSKVKVPMS